MHHTAEWSIHGTKPFFTKLGWVGHLVGNFEGHGGQFLQWSIFAGVTRHSYFRSIADQSIMSRVTPTGQLNGTVL